MPRRIAAPAIALLVVLAAGCGGSESTSTSPITAPGDSASSAATSGASGTTAASATTKATATTKASAATTASASATTKAASSGGDANAFCKKLSEGADQTAELMTSIGKPNMAAILEKVRAENAAILAAAPADIHDAIAKVYALSELSQKALDPSLSPTDRIAAGKAVTDAVKDPALNAAIADYTTWVSTHCGDLTNKILSAGKVS